MSPKYQREPVLAGNTVYYPRIKKELAAIPTDIETKSLPVGRVSVDNVTFGELMREFVSEMGSVGKIFPLEYLEAMQNISLVNPDVA